MKLQESEKAIAEYVGRARLAGKISVTAKLLGNKLVISATPTHYQIVNTTSLADDSLTISLEQSKHVNGMLVSGDIELEMNTDFQVAAIILKEIQNELDNAEET